MTLTKKKNDSSTIRIWDRLQIVVGDEGKEGVYTSRVSDIEQDRLVISKPVFSYGKSLLANNRRISVNFTRADAAYSFAARITKDNSPEDSDDMYLVDLGEVKRLQRRRFVRVDKIVKLGYLILTKPIEEKLEIGTSRFKQSHTLNISAGGLLMPIDEDDDLKVDDLLLLNLSRSGLKSLSSFIIGVIRQARENDDRQKVVGLEFILKEDLHLYFGKHDLSHLPEDAKQFTSKVQNDLVGEMFNEQLALRQKGLI